jgi:uncharacterized protein
MAVFLDTVGLLALWDTTDQWHQCAEAAFEKLSRARTGLITTTFILLECGNSAARRPYRELPNRLREKLEATDMLVVPTVDDWNNAWIAYKNGQADEAGIVDQVSFAVMRRLDISKAFTNDHHFRAAGFEVLF